MGSRLCPAEPARNLHPHRQLLAVDTREAAGRVSVRAEGCCRAECLNVISEEKMVQRLKELFI